MRTFSLESLGVSGTGTPVVSAPFATVAEAAMFARARQETLSALGVPALSWRLMANEDNGGVSLTQPEIEEFCDLCAGYGLSTF